MPLVSASVHSSERNKMRHLGWFSYTVPLLTIPNACRLGNSDTLNDTMFNLLHNSTTHKCVLHYLNNSRNTNNKCGTSDKSKKK